MKDVPTGGPSALDSPNVRNTYLEIDRENSEDEAALGRYAGAEECASDGFS